MLLKVNAVKVKLELVIELKFAGHTPGLPGGSGVNIAASRGSNGFMVDSPVPVMVVAPPLLRPEPEARVTHAAGIATLLTVLTSKAINDSFTLITLRAEDASFCRPVPAESPPALQVVGHKRTSFSPENGNNIVEYCRGT